MVEGGDGEVLDVGNGAGQGGPPSPRHLHRPGHLVDGQLPPGAPAGQHQVGGLGHGQAGHCHPRPHLKSLQAVHAPAVPEHSAGGGAQGEVGGRVEESL